MAHAIPVDNGLCGKAEIMADYMKLVDDGDLSANDVKNMVGNGWHVGSIGSWLMFVLSAVEFHEGLSMPKPLPASDDVEEVIDSPPRRKKYCPGLGDRQGWSSPEAISSFSPLIHQSPAALGGGFEEIMGGIDTSVTSCHGWESKDVVDITEDTQPEPL